MRQFFFLCLCGLLLLSNAEAAYQVEMEHSFATEEGSSWGIEGQLKNALQIPAEKIPILFKKTLLRPRPEVLSMKDQSLAQNFFIGDRLYLYRSLNICIDVNISYKTPGFNQALNNFLYKLTQISVERQALPLEFIDVSFKSADLHVLSSCDVFVLVGNENEFPFAQIKNQGAPQFSNIPQMILGLYYRHSEATVPVIVFNPTVRLDFSSQQKEYMRAQEDGTVSVDGRTLFFHEMGHLFGLSHIKSGGNWKPFSQLTVMGLDSTQYEDENFAIRYQANFEVWENWDIRQTSVYRALFSRWIQGENFAKDVDLFDKKKHISPFYCVLPGEDLRIAFTPLRVTGLSGVYRAPDGSDMISLIPLNQEDERIRSERSLKAKYQVFPKEWFEKIEINNQAEKHYLTSMVMERSFFRAVDNLGSEDWLLLSLSGRIESSVAREFSLSGTYTIDKMAKAFFPMMKIQVESDQRLCYRKNE